MLATWQSRFDQWLSSPEVNAAGRMSIYRIIYGLFYLTQLPALLSYYYPTYAPLPASEWQTIFTVGLVSQTPSPAGFYHIVPLVLTFALVLVTVGLWTRPALLAVLICGTFLSISFYSFLGQVDHDDTFLVIYIPALMLFSHWDSNYAVDAIRHTRRTGQQTSPHNPSWIFVWPQRAFILLLALLFCSAGLLKLVRGWAYDFERLISILLLRNRVAVLREVPVNPLTPLIIQVPALAVLLQFVGALGEFLFPLSVLNRRLRTFFFAAMVLMHVFNQLFLYINFYQMLIVYLMVIDWEALLGSQFRRMQFIQRLPTFVLIAGSLLLATAITIIAAFVDLRQTFHLYDFGLLIAAPIALYWLVRSGLAILRYDILRRSAPAVPSNVPEHSSYS